MLPLTDAQFDLGLRWLDLLPDNAKVPVLTPEPGLVQAPNGRDQP